MIHLKILILKTKEYTCLKPMGATCKTDSECANNLECMTETHLCGCNETVRNFFSISISIFN